MSRWSWAESNTASGEPLFAEAGSLVGGEKLSDVREPLPPVYVRSVSPELKTRLQAHGEPGGAKKSVPSSLRLRGDEWLKLAACEQVELVPKALQQLNINMHQSPSGIRQEFVVDTICEQSECSVEVLDQIDRDLPRTYPDVDYFANTDRRHTLGRVLQAIAIEYPQVSYVQGMNFLVANLLYHVRGSEDKAFLLFRCILQNPRYLMCHVFEPGLTNLQRLSDILESFVQKFMPKLHKHFDQIGLEPLFYSQNWIMTLFSYTMPFDVLASIWDNYFKVGWPAIFQTGLAILSLAQQELLEANFDAAAAILRRVAEEPHPDLLRTAESFHLFAEDLVLIEKGVGMKPFELTTHSIDDDGAITDENPLDTSRLESLGSVDDVDSSTDDAEKPNSDVSLSMISRIKGIMFSPPLEEYPRTVQACTLAYGAEPIQSSPGEDEEGSFEEDVDKASTGSTSSLPPAFTSSNPTLPAPPYSSLKLTPPPPAATRNSAPPPPYSSVTRSSTNSGFSL
mmetsp:Transcript_10500/g.18552  ORF Transcript_10500/g.18552 Transcript_10500/m.18552 type:complete len:509 (-) Transcript_10500:77-1603(-)